jgi:transcriptional regulator with XRE-family HTH domain
MPLWITLIDMTDHEKTRNAVSVALVELRKAMQMTQQRFAVEVLRTAIGTVARYETSDPPRGEVLLRLAAIAYELKRPDLARIFERAWLEQLPKTRGSHLTTNLTTGVSHLVAHISGRAAHAGAQAFMHILTQLESHDPKVRSNAQTALKSLEVAARRFDDPIVGEIQDAFSSALGASHPSVPENKPQKKSKQSTKGIKR